MQSKEIDEGKCGKRIEAQNNNNNHMKNKNLENPDESRVIKSFHFCNIIHKTYIG